ncbi:hypothetical protein [Hymenobacter tenuis]
MSVYAIHAIKGKAPVTKLFNEYLNALRTPDMAAAPRYSMKRFWKECDKPEDEDATMGRVAFNHYLLRTVNCSLHDLNRALKNAEDTLESFFKEGKTLEEWARANRLQMIEEYGGEPEDWFDTGAVDEAGEPVWAICEATPEDLTHYDLWDEMSRFFASGGMHGEYIGSSRPEDYNPTTIIVESQSVFSFRRMIEGVTGKPANLVTVNETGEQTPVSLGQMIEDEINEDLRGADVAGRFRGAIAACCMARTFFKRLDRTNPEDFRALLQLVQNIRQLNTAPF